MVGGDSTIQLTAGAEYSTLGLIIDGVKSEAGREPFRPFEVVQE